MLDKVNILTYLLTKRRDEMEKILPTSEVKAKMSEVMRGVTCNKEPIFITQYGRAKAVLLDYEEYGNLMERLDRLDDLLAMLEAEKEYRAGKYKELDEFVAECTEL